MAAPLPKGESLDAALDKFKEEMKLRNEETAKDLIEKLKQSLRGDEV